MKDLFKLFFFFFNLEIEKIHILPKYIYFSNFETKNVIFSFKNNEGFEIETTNLLVTQAGAC